MTVGSIPGLIETGPVWSANLYQAEIVPRPEDWLSRGEAEEVFLAEYGKVSRRTLDALLAAERDGADPPEGESLDWIDEARFAFTEQRWNLLLSFDKLDLSGRDLRRANLRDAFLPGVRLPGARLGGADMTGAQMEGVVFSGEVNGEFVAADLAGAPCDQERWDRIQPEPPEIPPARTALGCTRLRGAHLEGAALFEANLSGAALGGADLSGAVLIEANLSGAVFVGANLSGAVLFEANLSGAYLAGANLSGAALRTANLSAAHLGSADLSGADLAWANLSGAVLSGANLSGADLRWANLLGVDFGDLRGAEGIQLEGAVGDDKTRLPPRWPTPHVIATCYDTLDERDILSRVHSWQIDEATFRARYVCPEGTEPGRIEGPLGAPPD
jgi:uncharacterized protein YjbI with pentapeptide repeats